MHNYRTLRRHRGSPTSQFSERHWPYRCWFFPLRALPGGIYTVNAVSSVKRRKNMQNTSMKVIFTNGSKKGSLIVLKIQPVELQRWTSVTVISWTYRLPSRLAKRIWTSFPRSASPSLAWMIAWSVSLNWSGKMSQLHNAHISTAISVVRSVNMH